MLIIVISKSNDSKDWFDVGLIIGVCCGSLVCALEGFITMFLVMEFVSFCLGEADVSDQVGDTVMANNLRRLEF